jgi:hypothetical protein
MKLWRSEAQLLSDAAIVIVIDVLFFGQHKSCHIDCNESSTGHKMVMAHACCVMVPGVPLKIMASL